MKIRTGRPVTRAPNGMVTSPHSLASAAGVDVLRAGGSAVDAAIAASAALTVVYPHMTSLGGDAFWLIHEGATGTIKYLNGGGRAAASAKLEWFAAEGLNEIPFRGVIPATLTVPGAVASWAEAHECYGRLPLSRNLEAAVSYARTGFPASGRLAAFAVATRDDLGRSQEAAAIFLPNGEPIKEGQRVINQDLARSLDVIGCEGRSAFYQGSIAEEMDRFSREQGGFFRASDFANQTASWSDPISGHYRGIALYNTPPPTQGFAVIEMLNMIEGHDPRRIDHLGADYVHLLVQAKQIAYHDRDQFLGDPQFVSVPTARLLSKSYAAERALIMDSRAALPWDKIPSFGSLTGDTVYVAAIDSEGNAVSLIQSLYGVFGSAVVAGNTGIVLQNRGAYFSLNPTHPNRLEPGKIPLHTLIASMAKRNGKLWCVLGCMGADGQPQIQVQAYLGLIDYGLNIQQAVEMPRFLSGRFALGEARDTLHVEAGFKDGAIEDLERRGHIVERWGKWNEFAGHAHGIIVDSEGGSLAGEKRWRSDRLLNFWTCDCQISGARHVFNCEYQAYCGDCETCSTDDTAICRTLQKPIHAREVLIGKARNLAGKAVGVVEVGLAGRVCQRPIGLVAVGFFDHGGEAKTGSSVRLIQRDLGSQRVAIGRRLRLDSWRTDFGRGTHAAAIVVEPIGRPLCRRREIELDIGRRRIGTDECFEAGMAPKLVGARG